MKMPSTRMDAFASSKMAIYYKEEEDVQSMSPRENLAILHSGHVRPLPQVAPVPLPLVAREVMSVTIIAVEQGCPVPNVTASIIPKFDEQLVDSQWVIVRNSMQLCVYAGLHLRSCYQSATNSLNWSVGAVKTGLDEERFFNMGDGRWVKGQSGNPAGRSKRRRLFDDHLREALSVKRGAVARRLVERLIGEAAQGNVPALKLICERIGGRPKNAEDAAVTNGDELTLVQVRAKLAELLSRPEVKRNLQSLLAGSDELKTDVLQ